MADSSLINSAGLQQFGNEFKGNLANVAVSGNYSDLSNTPTFANVAKDGEYSSLNNIPTFANVANSGDYRDLSFKIPFGTNFQDGDNNNIPIGYSSVACNTSIAIGYNAQATYANNISIGRNAKVDVNGGIAIGNNSRTGTTSHATNAICIGEGATSWSKNSISIGHTTFTGGSDSTGNAIAIGYNASAGSDYSIAIGAKASSTYYNGISIGYNVTSNGGIAIGYGINVASIGSVGIRTNIYGSGIGIFSESIPVGVASGIALGFGYLAPTENITTTGQITIGYSSASQKNDSIAIGRMAYGYGTASIAIGAGANTHNARTTSDILYGAECISIGHNATIQRGYNNTIVGSGRSSITGCNNSTVLGYNSWCSTDNTIQLGNSNVTALKCQVTVITTSDIRDKTDIKPITKSLDFLNTLEPITYVRNDRSLYNYEDKEDEENPYIGYCFHLYDKEEHAKGTKKGSRRRAGLSAQAVQKAMKDFYGDDSYANLVDDNLRNFTDVPEEVENKYGISYENFVPFLIKAIQELSAKVDALEAK